MLLLGEDDASNGSGPIGTEEGETEISAEKGAAAPTMPKPEAGTEDSSLAPSQCTVSVATTHNH